MEIIRIFVVVNRSLLSVQFYGEAEDAFTILFEQWSDVEYLEDFFENNKADLQSGFFGEISVEEAVRVTIDEAERVEEYVRRLARASKASRREQQIDFVVKDLKANDPSFQLVKTKAYGVSKPSWLRIYAIRIAENLYVVSGGAIKLTKTMNDRQHLRDELEKLECVKQYLINNGLISEADYQCFELGRYDER